MSADAITARAVAALEGALLGDAIGAPLEFLGRAPTRDEVRAATRLPGGGHWRLAPGQITDDGELTLALGRALREAPAFDLDVIAEGYRAWLASGPFDVGETTRAAFEVSGRRGLAAAMRRHARAASLASQANGSLMRCVPLAIWGHRLPPAQLAWAASGDSALSHPHRACRQAVSAYTISLAALIDGAGPPEAIARARRWAGRRQPVAGWLAEAAGASPCPCYPKAGWVRIALVLAIRALASGEPYLAAIEAVLAGGGDTDTNAAITGGLIAAVQPPPDQLTAAMRESDTAAGAHPRPARYHPADAPALAAALVERAPRRLPGWLRRLRAVIA